jgi:hypothetical protein
MKPRSDASSFQKKAQMEIMGLAIIVILLSMTFLFVIQFVLLKEPTQESKEYAQSELAANFLNTLLETDAECANIEISTLFQDCTNNCNEDTAGECRGNLQCQGRSSCIYLKGTVKDILNDTFDQWNINYYFAATHDINAPTDISKHIFHPISSDNSGDPIEKHFENVCPGNRKLKVQPLPADSPLYLILYICD